MIPFALEPSSSTTDYMQGPIYKPQQADIEDGGFFPLIRNLMGPLQNESPERASELSDSEPAWKAKEAHYLDDLRRRLLAKGRPLNELSIKKEDIYLLQKFLHKCGFSKEEAKELLEELKQDNDTGNINLSRFFLKIEEYSAQGKRTGEPLIIDPSAIPLLESALKDFGLTPKQVGQALESSQINAGLNLKDLLQRLKEISESGGSGTDYRKLNHFVKALEDMIYRESGLHQSLKSDHLGWREKASGVMGPVANNPQGTNHPFIGRHWFQHVAKKMEGLGNQNIRSEKDSMTASKQSRENPGNGDQSSKDVLSDIDKIMESVVTAGKKKSPSSERQHILAAMREKRGLQDGPGKQRVISPQDSNKAGMLHNGNIGQETLHGMKESTGDQPKVFDLAADANISHDLVHRGDESSNNGRSDAGNIHTLQNLNVSKEGNWIQENQRPIRDSLPSYLVAQVGKQISRSILRGEKVLRLQLKPPQLGTLRVEVDMKDHVLKLGMIAENSSVKDMLLSNVHDLKEALLDQGVRLEKMDIDIGGGFSQSLANLKDGSKEGFGGEQRKIQDWDDGRMIQNQGAGGDPGWDARAGDRSLLDLMA